MILIYAHITSARLQYICGFIFNDLMGLDFRITIDQEEFSHYEGVKINYSDTLIQGPALNINNHSLLFEEIIIPQQIQCFAWNKAKAFFKTNNADFPFDIFAASFYLVSRYEEYLPHERDSYGRYAHENSLAFKKGFLQLPLVNIWVAELINSLHIKFPTFSLHPPIFSFTPTYDIDIAYSYKHKGLLRNIAGFLRSPSLNRIKVLLGKEKDPFDAYDYLHGLHEKYNLHPLYFFLVAEKKGIYDKNISPDKEAMWKLVKRHTNKYIIGLHPSWQSGENFSQLKKERNQLEAMCETPVTKSRQHYIRFYLPNGYRRLADAGITDDYSMGYGSINGFRASVASSFYWYDLEKEQPTKLRVHPFCFMEANAFYEQHLSPAQAFAELMHYYHACKSVNGTMITIWHNNFLGTDEQFAGWREIYERFIVQVQQ